VDHRGRAETLQLKKSKKTKKQIKNQKNKKQKKMYIFFLHPNTGLLIEN